MRILLSLCLGMCLLSSGTALGQDLLSNAYATKVKGPILLDGILDDFCPVQQSN